MSDLRLDPFIPESKPSSASESNGVGNGRNDMPAAEAAWQRALHQAQQDGFASWFGSSSLASSARPFEPPLTAALRAPSSSVFAAHASPVPGAYSSEAATGQQSQESRRSADGPRREGSESSDSRRTDRHQHDADATGTNSTDRQMPATAASAQGVSQSAIGASREMMAVDAAGIRGTNTLIAAIARIAMTPVIAVPSVEALGLTSGAPLQSLVEMAFSTSERDVPVDSTDHEVEAGDEASSHEAPAVRESARSEAGDPDSLRVYAEWSEHGVKIWLGASSNTAPTAESITPQLQLWLAIHGEKLLSVVCNGRLLWSGAHGMASEAPISAVSFATDVTVSAAAASTLPEANAGAADAHQAETFNPNSSENV